MNYLVFETPAYFSHGNFRVNSYEFTTQLPRNIAAIRIVAVIAFTALAAIFSEPIFVLPFCILGGALAGWTIYKHLISKDPLIEAFYKILGGKSEFDKLPEFDLIQDPNEKICNSIDKIDWDKLQYPISKTKTLDGRNIIILKKYNEYDVINPNFINKLTRKSLFVFIEKMGPSDFILSQPFSFSFLNRRVADWINSALEAIEHPFSSNSYRTTLRDRGGNLNGDPTTSVSEERFVESSLTSDFANKIKVAILEKNRRV